MSYKANPYLNKKAIALGYEAGTDAAPKVKAKGKGYVAEEIVARAKAAEIPLQEDSSLVELLSQLEVNEKIPDNLYEVVAEIFAFIYKVDKEQQNSGK
ncbi:EscU/YscU/HrcU family type III secretion system export apparatus switch protein [Alkalicoccus daliensis]|uniref:Flagellar biosynthesis protein n=1 Tax=Alkalicoccus daliensis TaxID=745820 RepID=A0A1H0A2H0_9BACI|nr:EscU/YscU/HrcU family type III secretion system export apparatus switch protein [Alkalicoccus daliensis]SDN27494.1 flagellar biosynthesis protein [Alkalicoccus daliensis]